MFLNQSCFVSDETIDNPDTIIKPEDSTEFTQIIIALGDVKFLPKIISTFFPQLETFSSTNGKFEEISKENFESLSKLQNLFLTVGNLKKIDKNSFEDLNSLSTLNLADNKIEFLNSKTLNNLINLVILDISGNQIEILHPKSFENLSNLMILRLSKNKLETLDRKLFMNKPKLEEIHARQNNFKHIDEFTFDGLPLDFLNIFSENCRIGIYNSKVNLIELKEDLRDNCKGSDFIIHQIHGKMLEILNKNNDEGEIY